MSPSSVSGVHTISAGRPAQQKRQWAARLTVDTFALTAVPALNGAARQGVHSVVYSLWFSDLLLPHIRSGTESKPSRITDLQSLVELRHGSPRRIWKAMLQLWLGNLGQDHMQLQHAQGRPDGVKLVQGKRSHNRVLLKLLLLIRFGGGEGEGPGRGGGVWLGSLGICGEPPRDTMR